MTYGQRLGACALASIAGHLLLAERTAHLPPQPNAPATVVTVSLREPPPPPPEPAKPEAAPSAKEPTHEIPTRHARRTTTEAPKQVVPTKNITPTERPATSPNTSDTPVFGLSMESTSSAGSGPGFRVGNTLQTQPKGSAGENEANAGKALLEPVPAYEVTKMPLPKGECSGQYTSEARESGLEGVVILSFVVDERGHVRDIKVLQGLGGGLTEAAKRAVQVCAFSPGERNGKPVPTRVPNYKVRFNLRENE